MSTIYILGAGFSRPAGLPLMSDFIHKAKDHRYKNGDKLKMLDEIVDIVRKYSTIKNYTNTNLDNIEELLSIYESQNLTNGNVNNPFREFITETILAYTPEFIDDLKWVYNPGLHYLYNSNTTLTGYFLFAMSVFGYDVYMSLQHKSMSLQKKIGNNNKIITFNYDLVIENSIKGIAGINNSDDVLNAINGNIFHLHGRVDRPETIIAPSWNKKMSELLLSEWEQSFSAIANARKIVIIGYSFPESDSYFQYFLKAALVNNDDLRSVHVCKLVNDKEIENRALKIFSKNKIKFHNHTTEDIFSNIFQESSKDSDVQYSIFRLRNMDEYLFS